MNKTIYLTPVIILMFLCSCMEDFNPNVGTKPVLCINSLITAGEPIKVNVSRTWFYTDTAGASNHSVTDAAVYIYANGSPVDVDNWIPRAGDLVRIEAYSPTYGEASAEVRVPLPPVAEVIEVDTLLTDIRPFDYGKFPVAGILVFNLKVKVRVHDPNPVPDYYHIGFSTAANGEILDDNGNHVISSALMMGDINYDAEPIFSEHIGDLDYVTGSDSYGFNFFTDRQFSGTDYTLHLDFTGMQYMLQATHFNPTDVECLFIINLDGVSESYYNYANYQWQTGEGILGNLSDIGFSEPVWAYSNVTTGAGLVCARTPVQLTVDLRKFILGNLEEGIR